MMTLNIDPSTIFSGIAVLLIAFQFRWQRRVDVELARIKTILKMKDENDAD